MGEKKPAIGPGNDRPWEMGTPLGMPRCVYSQVPVAKIEYESERPTWENPLAQMRRGIAVAEPDILNEIREPATRPMRKKTHFNDLVKTLKRLTFLARTRARFRVAINDILKVAPVRGASRIRKPRDRLRKFHGHRNSLLLIADLSCTC